MLTRIGENYPGKNEDQFEKEVQKKPSGKWTRSTQSTEDGSRKGVGQTEDQNKIRLTTPCGFGADLMPSKSGLVSICK